MRGWDWLFFTHCHIKIKSRNPFVEVLPIKENPTRTGVAKFSFISALKEFLLVALISHPDHRTPSFLVIEATGPAHAMPCDQCDQIGRFFALWATF